MTFTKMIKVLGIRALFEECNNNLLLIKQFINIHFKKNESFDTSRYMREIKEYLVIDFDKTYFAYKPNVLEVIKKVKFEG